MTDLLTWKEGITLALAMLGAVLGVLNTWNAISQRRVRLRVKPAYAFAVPAGNTMFGIEVVNLSNFAVTVTEVGFTLNGRTLKRQRAAIPQPILIDGKPWPRRLEARESVSTYFDPREVIGSGRQIGRAYVQTSCGEVAFGTSPALEQLRDMARV